ncbi:FecCD family ABC transporter permease [Aquibacillus kalidii]|uniref:FecCD family ABC transporter permease n=1 Tax=Aquibacillus kalidii TaxID=2762597 RepID=UPI00164945AE|nr:iron ABC transporter permease [Aquibacillus kalidii]
MSNYSKAPYRWSLAIILLLTITIVWISLMNGTYELTIQEVFRSLFRIEANPDHDLVIFDFRLPRIVLAGLVGFSLGIAGAVLQGITRNGLADPGILGINAGAGAAIVLFMFFFQSQLDLSHWFTIMIQPLFGLIGGLAAASIILIFSLKNGSLDSQRLLLTGIAIGSGFGALALYLSLKMKAADFEMATVWISGSIYNANWVFIASMLPWLLFLVPIIYKKASMLDYFQLEEESMKSLGIVVDREKIVLLLASIGLVSASVSVSGSIGFIGLMSPHIAKRLVGIHHKQVIPICGAIGMFLVITSDFIAKTVFAPVEIPVGIVISIIGVPYFLYLLMKEKA